MENEPKIPGGYILLSRKIIESEIWDKPPLYMKVWVYLLSKAQHKPYKKMDRGQTFISIPELMEACSWYVGYRKEKPTKDQIYNVLKWLRSADESLHEGETKETMITTTKATQGMLVNVCNYAFYQDPKNYESNNETNNESRAKATREQRQPDNINKNGKNVKNDKNEKEIYMDNVLLTDKEFKRLVSDYGEQVINSKIEDLDTYISNKGKNPYKDHNKTIRNWLKRDKVKTIKEKEEAQKKNEPTKEEKKLIRIRELKDIVRLTRDYYAMTNEEFIYDDALKELDTLE